MGETSHPASKQSEGIVMMNAEQGSHIDTIGTIILGVLCLLLLFAYMRAQGRNRKLLEKLAKHEK